MPNIEEQLPEPARSSDAVASEARPRRARRSPPGSELDGARLGTGTWVLLAAGTVGGLIFTGAYLAEGATRFGYAALAQPISALSLGPGGWVQRLNFVLFGVAMAASAPGVPGPRAVRPECAVRTGSGRRVPTMTALSSAREEMRRTHDLGCVLPGQSGGG